MAAVAVDWFAARGDLGEADWLTGGVLGADWSAAVDVAGGEAGGRVGEAVFEGGAECAGDVLVIAGIIGVGAPESPIPWVIPS